jgi:hypothetical protein
MPCCAQVAEGLQLSGEQRRSVACLWRNFDGRLERILAARRSLHAQISASMPNGVMGRDFAVNFLKVNPASCATNPLPMHPLHTCGAATCHAYLLQNGPVGLSIGEGRLQVPLSCCSGVCRLMRAWTR